VCARGGSKGIKNKNIKKLFNKPLILHTLLQAKKSRIFDKIIVSTDSNKIINICKRKVDYIVKRPKKLSTGKASKIFAIKHALTQAEINFKKKFDIVIDLDATSPLRNIDDIIRAKNKFVRNKYENLISVCHSKKNPYFNIVEKTKKGLKLVRETEKNYVRRQDAPDVYDINASIYIWKRTALLNTNKVVKNKTGFYIMPKIRSIDIDDYFDFKLVEFLMKRKH
jgi:CMP-N-acetylneuraminic acid synthetase